MDLVDYGPFQVRKGRQHALLGEHDDERLGRGDQHVGRLFGYAPAQALRRVAVAYLDGQAGGARVLGDAPEHVPVQGAQGSHVQGPDPAAPPLAAALPPRPAKALKDRHDRALGLARARRRDD